MSYAMATLSQWKIYASRSLTTLSFIINTWLNPSSGNSKASTKINITRHQLSAQYTSDLEAGITNFDLKKAKEYDIEDFNESLLRARIEKYCNRLGVDVPNNADGSWLRKQMLNLNLTRLDKSHNTFATYAGLLLFSNDIQQHVPSAKTAIKFTGPLRWLRDLIGDDKIAEEFVQQEATGNLWAQLDTITEALSLVNRPFRLKDQESKDVLPYDPIALKEVVVNSLVHRNYEINEPNFIEITPDTITIKNPGGLIDEVKGYFDDEQMIEHIRNGRRGIKGYRNPVLSDLFYGAGAMDKRGSGLSDVVSLVNKNAGHVEFSPNFENTNFTVTLQCRPEAVDEVTRTATPLNVITTKFVSNIIPIERLPERVYLAEPSFKTVKELFETYPSISFPPFKLHSGQLYTLTDLTSGRNVLRNGIDTTTINSIALDECLADAEGEKHLVYLLNQSLKNHFYHHKLTVDVKKKRVYFPKTEKGDRTISYQARVKKATRTVTRARYSANKEKIRYWEHKAFYYTIKKMGSQWGVFIEPTYVFTLDGDHEMLASKRIGALATKKSSRDYNMSVLNDLVFWMWVISSQSQEFFSLKTSSSEKLGDFIVLSTSFANTSINYVEFYDQEEEVEDEDESELDDEIGNLADMQREGKLDDESEDDEEEDEDNEDSDI